MDVQAILYANVHTHYSIHRITWRNRYMYTLKNIHTPTNSIMQLAHTYIKSVHRSAHSLNKRELRMVGSGKNVFSRIFEKVLEISFAFHERPKKGSIEKDRACGTRPQASDGKIQVPVCYYYYY